MRYIGYQENQVRGTFGFPIQLYYVDANHPQYEMPFHWHMESELILVLDGKLQLSVNGKSYTLEKGQSVFIPGEFIHGGTPQHCIYECVVFDIERFLSQSPQCVEKYRLALENGEIAEMVFEEDNKCGNIVDEIFVNMEKENASYTFATTGLLWLLVGSLLEQSVAPDINGADIVYRKNKQIKRVLTKIRNDYSKPLTLDDLAREAHLNSQYFCRAFKLLTGRSPIDYLNYYRIECAAEQLRFTELSVTEVAFSCGFNDLSYFNRMFKRRKNMTPTEYRNNMI